MSAKNHSPSPSSRAAKGAGSARERPPGSGTWLLSVPVGEGGGRLYETLHQAPRTRAGRRPKVVDDRLAEMRERAEKKRPGLPGAGRHSLAPLCDVKGCQNHQTGEIVELELKGTSPPTWVRVRPCASHRQHVLRHIERGNDGRESEDQPRPDRPARQPRL